MSLTNEQYNSLLHEYEEKQNSRRHLIDKRIAEIYLKIPAYREIDTSVGSISISYGKRLMDGDESALSSLRASLSEISAKKSSLLQQYGYSEDYLNPPYSCSDCRDTGYANGKKCHCFLQKITRLLYEQSNIREMLKTENFDNLSFDYYQGADFERFQNAVNTCHNFIDSFDSDYRNLFFYGTVGTGKSFLSGCLAKELIESGHCVIYFSAVGLFDMISKATFDYKNKEALYSVYEDIYNCDLVIIDDLGTELTNSFVSSQLFSFLNERHLRKKSTLISTNLSLEELRDRYSDRIFSRITSHFEICKLTGPDIRMYKKRMMNRK